MLPWYVIWYATYIIYSCVLIIISLCPRPSHLIITPTHEMKRGWEGLICTSVHMYCVDNVYTVFCAMSHNNWVLHVIRKIYKLVVVYMVELIHTIDPIPFPAMCIIIGKFTLSQEILLNANTLRMFIYCKALSYKWELPLL